MRNYIKSECYRITHTKAIYLFTGVLAALAFLFHCALRYFTTGYSITSFSYSNLVSNPMVFAAFGVLLAYYLYEDSYKNGSMKNTIASGISRVKIFAGKCIVSTAAATCSMILTITVWIISAELLLPKAGPVVFQDLLMETLMVYLIAVANLICGIVCMEIFQNIIAGLIVWSLIWFSIPKIFLYLAMRKSIFYPIALWLPQNFFGVNSSHVNMRECITIWDTASGMARCILSGLIGIAVFSLAGVLAVRKKDL